MSPYTNNYWSHLASTKSGDEYYGNASTRGPIAAAHALEAAAEKAVDAGWTGGSLTVYQKATSLTPNARHSSTSTSAEAVAYAQPMVVGVIGKPSPYPGHLRLRKATHASWDDVPSGPLL